MAKPITPEQFNKDVAVMWKQAVKESYEDLLQEAILAERTACIKAVEQSRAHQFVWYPEGYSVNPNKIDSFYEFQWQRSMDAIKART